tara:strand:+ start:1651 stop:1800 length:150 start_codon:yes stop_codon:yes gene_type:complete
MIKDFKRVKNKIIVNLSYMDLVLKSLDLIKDKRLNSNKLNKKSWLKRLY